MPSYVLTGTPGSGKTAMLRLLELVGYCVVEEAATDVIALEQARGEQEPSTRAGFIDTVVDLQRRRQLCAARCAGPIFFDRSPVCTLALSRFLDLQPTAALMAELDRITSEQIYEPAVFFVRHQGFVIATAARRISLADSYAFEEVHEQTYRELGFRLIEVPPGPVADRVAVVLRQVEGVNLCRGGEVSK